MKIYSKSDKGKVRSANQDAFITEKIEDDISYAVVCDGMGGAKAGNIASEIAVNSISSFISKSFKKNMTDNEIINIIKHSIINANIEIYDKAINNSEYDGMGTTVVFTLVVSKKAFIAHVGDSRIYLINDSIIQLTKDHSVVQSLIESGKITAEDAKFHPRKNIITRALGAEEDVMVDCNVVNIQNGDSLLLCTDGLTNYAEHEDIMNIFKNNNIAGVADKLVETANNNGGGDNITVVTITL